MLTRRTFGACALCAAGGFLAAGVEAQNVETPGVKRTLLKQIDGPMDGYVTIEARIEVEPGATIARHTHPGVESAYMIEGVCELTVEGEGTRTYMPGDAFQVSAGVPHGGKNGPAKSVFADTFVVEKGKPLASPA
jgi:quercetin dioxygenase-like cupin family protein